MNVIELVIDGETDLTPYTNLRMLRWKDAPSSSILALLTPNLEELYLGNVVIPYNDLRAIIERIRGTFLRRLEFNRSKADFLSLLSLV